MDTFKLPYNVVLIYVHFFLLFNTVDGHFAPEDVNLLVMATQSQSTL